MIIDISFVHLCISSDIRVVQLYEHRSLKLVKLLVLRQSCGVYYPKS